MEIYVEPKIPYKLSYILACLNLPPCLDYRSAFERSTAFWLFLRLFTLKNNLMDL